MLPQRYGEAYIWKDESAFSCRNNSGARRCYRSCNGEGYAMAVELFRTAETIFSFVVFYALRPLPQRVWRRLILVCRVRQRRFACVRLLRNYLLTRFPLSEL